MLNALFTKPIVIVAWQVESHGLLVNFKWKKSIYNKK
jgi:hypothetical protein